MTWAEWSIVGAGAAALLILNKLVIEDRGSDVLTVVYIGALLGEGVVLLARWVRARSAGTHG